MPTPDRTPGVADEEGIILEDTVVPTVEGEIRYQGGQFRFFDNQGEYDPRTGGVNPLGSVMVNSLTGDIYTSCTDGEIYLME